MFLPPEVISVRHERNFQRWPRGYEWLESDLTPVGVHRWVTDPTASAQAVSWACHPAGLSWTYCCIDEGVLSKADLPGAGVLGVRTIPKAMSRYHWSASWYIVTGILKRD